jgi:hypothetical protein
MTQAASSPHNGNTADTVKKYSKVTIIPVSNNSELIEFDPNVPEQVVTALANLAIASSGQFSVAATVSEDYRSSENWRVKPKWMAAGYNEETELSFADLKALNT